MGNDSKLQGPDSMNRFSRFAGQRTGSRARILSRLSPTSTERKADVFITFRNKWDEWVAGNMRPSIKQEGAEMILSNIRQTFIKLAESKDIISHLEGRHIITDAHKHLLKQANFSFEVILGTQCFDPERTKVTGVYMTVLIQADIGRDKEALGFLSYFKFDENWCFIDSPVRDTLYEKFLRQQIIEPREKAEEGFKKAVDPDEKEAYGGMLAQQPTLSLTGVAQKLLNGEKTSPGCYQALRKQLAEVQAGLNLSPVELGKIVEDFIHQRAERGGIKADESASVYSQGNRAVFLVPPVISDDRLLLFFASPPPPCSIL